MCIKKLISPALRLGAGNFGLAGLAAESLLKKKKKKKQGGRVAPLGGGSLRGDPFGMESRSMFEPFNARR